MDKPVYQVFVDHKKLIFPNTPAHENQQILFTGTKKLTFKFVDHNYIKICERDEDDDKTVIYLNHKKFVKNIAYEAFSHLPSDMTFEKAVQKLQNLSDFPRFSPRFAAYNHWGLVVLGT